MTGYGRAAAENESYRIAVSVRTVNNRFLDLALRLPEDLRELESELRSAVDAHVARGRVELKVAVETLQPGATAVSIHRDLVERVLQALSEIEGPGLSDRPLDRADLLRVTDLVRVERAPTTLAAADRRLILDTVTNALEGVVRMREVEGAALAEVLFERLDTLEHLASHLATEREAVREQLLEGMRTRLSGLARQVEISEERLAQETVLLAEKSDIQEELDRLRGHLKHCRETMTEGEAIGRRLDFLAQEIHRELNTLSAKCRDLQMARWVVDAKVTCEQLREQIQNVE